MYLRVYCVPSHMCIAASHVCLSTFTRVPVLPHMCACAYGSQMLTSGCLLSHSPLYCFETGPLNKPAPYLFTQAGLSPGPRTLLFLLPSAWTKTCAAMSDVYLWVLGLQMKPSRTHGRCATGRAILLPSMDTFALSLPLLCPI